MKAKSKPIRVSEPIHLSLKIEASKQGMPIQEWVESLIKFGRKAIREAKAAK